jgi:hypothetical protein
MVYRLVKVFVFALFSAFAAAASAAGGSFEVLAKDKPNDGGGAVIVAWTRPEGKVGGYRVLRLDKDGKEIEIGINPPDETKFVDDGAKGSKPDNGVPYRYVVKVLFTDGTEIKSQPSKPAVCRASWFNTGRIVNLCAIFLFCAIFFVIIRLARGGRAINIRPIAAFDAVADAVGRAAEMGRPIFYIPGLQDASDPATLASLSIFSKVVEKAARLRTRVKVPNYSPTTWPVAQNVMREAYMKSGRPEDYDPADVTYLTSRSFTYTAAVVGMMAREKPATNFLIGRFYSESLILAETGAATGAVQIGGTDTDTQLPFFIATCDHTLIGEEVFAAAAHASDDPVIKSTVAAQDWFKAAAVVLIVTGVVLSILGALGFDNFGELGARLSSFLQEAKQ